ncbi:hypothetical protein Cgig2_010234 [Carnegiea gigantea]|uniref:Uncharacterized protein n=1 Tax=Carnegiea gigantea TaxID=171969 RepID=A0A9Q1JW01_9CARY|nr:hypothetical protein Cgig2_010234 [Carnegiea gigantea]
MENEQEESSYIHLQMGHKVSQSKGEKEQQRERGPLEWFMETCQDKDGSYHELMSQKFVDTALGIVKQKTGASNVVFSETTVQAETFTYRKLMRPKSGGRFRGVGYGVTSDQLRGKRICQNGIGASNTIIASELLKETVVVEENTMTKSFLNVEHRREALRTSYRLPESNETSLSNAREMENPVILDQKSFDHVDG